MQHLLRFRFSRFRHWLNRKRFQKSWKITETLLERARHALPIRHEHEYAALSTQYREFLEHNELELALDTLEELGHLISARGEFWRDLERAAENMGLVDRLPALRKAFSEAPEPQKSLQMDRTDYRYNLEYRAAVRAQMLALARGLIAGDLDLIAAARKLSAFSCFFSDVFEPEIGALINVFWAIHTETDALPIGEERALWNAEALAREDKKISAAEERWRHEAVTAATQLIRLLEQNS
jgi:hypothetical protein